jgi:hypothetical protein
MKIGHYQPGPEYQTSSKGTFSIEL